MTRLVFRDMGHRRPTGYKSLQEILSYIEKNDFENNITIDLRGCVFSYPFAQILEKIVLKISSMPGDKSIQLIHAYSSAFEDHLAPYLTKKVDYIASGITTLRELKDELSSKYDVILEIIEKKYE